MVYGLGNIIEIVSLNLNVCTYVQMERGIAGREGVGKGRRKCLYLKLVFPKFLTRCEAVFAM